LLNNNTQVQRTKSRTTRTGH